MDRIADYFLDRHLGADDRGGFYLARPPDRIGVDAEYVAVKVWPTAADADLVREAMRELKHFAAVARVRSEYLIRLYDVGQENDVFFSSMEYFPLGTLETPSRPLARPEVLRAVAHAARAAHALHEAGIAHRNIKPSNILLREDGARLSDLGVVQTISAMTVTGIGAIDSIEFLDPRIVGSRERPSRASDIWSLGATLHRALTGAGIYGELPAGDPVYAVRKALSERPMLDATLAPDERAVIEACLNVDPERRPHTAMAVAEMIEALTPAELAGGSPNDR